MDGFNIGNSYPKPMEYSEKYPTEDYVTSVSQLVNVKMDIEFVTEKVFSLFDKYGTDGYLGESVSQLEHAVQCAMLAEEEDGNVEVVLGALLHDIGHLVGQADEVAHMETDGVVLGVQGHDHIGEAFLTGLGVPSDVTCFVTGHVQAKRYLTWKDPGYYENLSDASKMTLDHQGGPMCQNEAQQFEKNERLKAILRMRTWDERAKDKDLKIEPIAKYRQMFSVYLARVKSGRT